MKKGLFIAIVTAFAFGAGFLACGWMERHRPLPPPPGRFGWEFFHPHPMGRMGEFHRDHPINRAELRAQIAELEPQLEQFRAKMAAIDVEFDRQMDAVLSADQRKQRSDHLKQVRDDRTAEEKSRRPVSDDQITFMLRDQPAQTIMWDVVIPFRLDMLTRNYKLDDAQRDKVRVLLKARREKILELIDSSPPPSVTLVRLAPWVERMLRPPPPSPEPK